MQTKGLISGVHCRILKLTGFFSSLTPLAAALAAAVAAAVLALSIAAVARVASGSENRTHIAKHTLKIKSRTQKATAQNCHVQNPQGQCLT